jgi:hypothetical protein
MKFMVVDTQQSGHIQKPQSKKDLNATTKVKRYNKKQQEFIQQT